MRRPWISAIAAATCLLVLAAPAFAMTLGNSLLRQFEPTHEIRGGVSAAAEALGPGALGPLKVLVSFDDRTANQPDNAPVLAAVERRITEAPNVATVTPPVFGDDNRSALMSVVLSIDPEDPEARTTIDWLRANLPAAAGDRATVDVDHPGPLAPQLVETSHHAFHGAAPRDAKRFAR